MARDYPRSFVGPKLRDAILLARSRIFRGNSSRVRSTVAKALQIHSWREGPLGHVFCASSSREEEVVVTKFNKILAPTDLSPLSRPAVRYALEIGLEQGAEVIVYYVISAEGEWFGKNDPCDPAGVFVPRHKELLREFVKENFADMVGKVKITEAVETGVPYNKIVTKAEQESADLIVMSTHGRTGIEQLMLGSVTARVVARATCPVLSIRPTGKLRDRVAP
jgi:nucleotide-binding universal stress UspA family protein